MTRKKFRFYFFLNTIKVVVLFALLLSLSACKNSIDGMLDPKGLVAFEERKLFFDTLALMLIVVIPVIIMSLAFVYHYRHHRLRDYKPNWSHSYFLEGIWWGIPCVIIVILGILTWKKTHEFDPFTKIVGHDEAPLVIEAIALPWKWLFIYPKENIATLNYLQIPVNQQVEFLITADNVPMSALFIPQLGSQIYAMAGMRTKLYLLANTPGEYLGMNTLFNGAGFVDMQFKVNVVTPDQMDPWYAQIKKSSTQLTNDVYTKLLMSSINNTATFYSHVDEHLFQDVINLYMNSSGPMHPRQQQAKFQYTITEEK